MYEYAYLLACLCMSLVWFFLFLLRKDLRLQQIKLSLLTAPLAPVTQVFWFSKDYWRPEYAYSFHISGVPIGFEEIFFAFLVGGIGGVLYEVIFRKRYIPGKKRTKQTLISILTGAVLFYVLFTYFGINSIWASSISLASVAFVLVYLCPKLLWDSVLTAALMFGLCILIYLCWLFFFPDLISRFWVSDGLSGFGLLGIPIEEMVWFLSWGAFSGVIYEYWLNVRAYSSLKRI